MVLSVRITKWIMIPVINSYLYGVYDRLLNNILVLTIDP